MPSVEPLPKQYYIRINGSRCPGGDEFVLEPSGEIVELQNKDPAHEAQKWRVFCVLGVRGREVSWSGARFENVETGKSLLYEGNGSPLTTEVWHTDQDDDAFVWQIRPSRDKGRHAGECSIWSVVEECVIDANGHQPCHGAEALGFGWKGNNNQYWIIHEA